MNRTLIVGALFAALAPALVLLAGCMSPGGSVDLIDMVTKSRTIERGDAEVVEVFLDTNIGSFVVRGGAVGLMEADFTYNILEWEPSVDYRESGRKGVLTVRQPDLESKSVPKGATNEWDVRLADGVPMSIFLDSAVGEVRIDLSGLTVTRLDVDQGIGSIDIDLGTRLSEDADINIDGGIGEVVLTLPENVGIMVDADIGLGSFTALGLSRQDGYYVNEAYGSADISVEVRIDAGIGGVTIKIGHGGRASV